MKPRLKSRAAVCLSALSLFGILTGLSITGGCGSNPPLPPVSTSPAELKPAHTESVGKGKHKVRVSVRDHDDESSVERFERRAREAKEKAGQ